MSINPIGAPSYDDLPAFDHARAEAAVRELLLAIGEDPDRDGLKNTPGRVARAYEELVSGLRQRPEDVLTTVFEMGHDELVLVRDLEMWSMCEHHLVPFTGVAHVGYIPAESGKITGLSKLARLVDVYAKRPQVQERLTTQVAEALMELLEARGVIVVIEAEHLCMTMRGVRKSGARTITSAVRGLMHNAATRSEARAVTSPAPMVRTTSPGAAPAARSATARSRSSATSRSAGSAVVIRAVMREESTPSMGSSRAAYTGSTRTTSAPERAAANSAANSLVRENMWGWNSTCTRWPSATARPAETAAATSVGWWA